MSIRKLPNVILSEAKNLLCTLKQRDSSLRLAQCRLTSFLRLVLEQGEGLVLEQREGMTFQSEVSGWRLVNKTEKGLELSWEGVRIISLDRSAAILGPSFVWVRDARLEEVKLETSKDILHW